MATVHHKYRVHRFSVKSSVQGSVKLRGKSVDLQSLRRAAANQDNLIVQENTTRLEDKVESSNLDQNKVIHFVLTIVTFGAWGLVWWWLILKSEGKTEQFFRGFDDAYWSYLIERDQPPASLHKMKLDSEHKQGHFDA